MLPWVVLLLLATGTLGAMIAVWMRQASASDGGACHECRMSSTKRIEPCACRRREPAPCFGSAGPVLFPRLAGVVQSRARQRFVLDMLPKRKGPAEWRALSVGDMSRRDFEA